MPGGFKFWLITFVVILYEILKFPYYRSKPGIIAEFEINIFKNLFKYKFKH